MTEPDYIVTRTLLRNHPVLVFDLDGTLIDTALDIAHSLNQALRDCGLPPLSPGQRPPDLFSPLPLMVEAAMPHNETDVTPSQVLAAYEKRRQQSSFAHSTLFAGVPEFLASCQKRGQAMVICTNRQYDDTLRALTHFGLDDFFDAVVGGDTAANPKPSPDPLLLALQRANSSPTEALMIGDSHIDALCAQQGNVKFIWHQRGYGGKEVLEHPRAGHFKSYVDLC